MKKPVTGPSLHSLTHIYIYICIYNIYIYIHIHTYHINWILSDFCRQYSVLYAMYTFPSIKLHSLFIISAPQSWSCQPLCFPREKGEMVDELTFSCQCQLSVVMVPVGMYKTLKNHGVFTIFQLVQDFSHQQDHTIYTYILLSGHQGTLAFFEAPGNHTFKKTRCQQGRPRADRYKWT